MAKRGRKRAVTESPFKPKTNSSDNGDEKRQREFRSQEVERRISAVRAIQIAESHSLLSQLRRLRSYFDQDQLKTPILQFFRENLPNLSLVENEKYKWVYEIKRNDRQNGGATACDSLQFSVKSVQKNLLEAANLQFPSHFGLEEPLENQMMGTRDAFQTPGVTGNRLSFGMTPKTLRQPKNGEVLLSVHGSPLGVYKEENLEAIHESEDGSHEGASQ